MHMNSIHGAYSEAEVESRMPWLSDLEDLALIHQKVSKWEWLLHTVLYLFEFMMLHLHRKVNIGTTWNFFRDTLGYLISRKRQ